MSELQLVPDELEAKWAELARHFPSAVSVVEAGMGLRDPIGTVTEIPATVRKRFCLPST